MHIIPFYNHSLVLLVAYTSVQSKHEMDISGVVLTGRFILLNQRNMYSYVLCQWVKYLFYLLSVESITFC